MTAAGSAAPPGWYATPAGTTAWWDGHQWHQTQPTAPAAPYRKVATLGGVVRVLYALLALVAAGQVGISLWRRQLVQQLIDTPGSVDAATLKNADDLAKLADAAALVLAVLAAVCAASWCKRVFANLHGVLRSRGLQYTPGWAAGWWFVPFANLVKPVQVVREAWKASSPTDQPGSMAWQVAKAPATISAWWTFVILSLFVSFLSGNGDNTDGVLSPTEFQNTMLRAAAAGGLRVVAAILAVVVFSSITKRHLARARWLGVVAP